MIGWLSLTVEVLILLLQLLILRRLGSGVDVTVEVEVEVPTEVHRGEREISPGWERPFVAADPADQRPSAQAAIAPAAQVHPCQREFSAGRDHGR